MTPNYPSCTAREKYPTQALTQENAKDVWVTVNQNQAALEGLDKIVSILSERLDPVLRHEPQPENAKVATPGYSTPLADTLNTLANGFNYQSDRLVELLERLSI